MKSVYFCDVTTNKGTKFENPLLPNELYLVGTLARENKSVEVTHRKVSDAEYKSIYG